MYPDGIQVVANLKRLGEKSALLTDRGEVLGNLTTRWNDLRKKHPKLIRAMVYNPDNQDWEDSALAIGRSVCEVFCPYFEQDKVQDAITQTMDSKE
ncbi:MAG: hypothetical protein JOZ08_10905 [Verrucomicrobia bacterium]|nr:hypothetical protein [Verrucomicrobiota bacterium]MBV8277606.1 hypothetical protein [Verrucomicrobiota bacterium]